MIYIRRWPSYQLVESFSCTKAGFPYTFWYWIESWIHLLLSKIRAKINFQGTLRLSPPALSCWNLILSRKQKLLVVVNVRWHSKVKTLLVSPLLGLISACTFTTMGKNAFNKICTLSLEKLLVLTLSCSIYTDNGSLYDSLIQQYLTQFIIVPPWLILAKLSPLLSLKRAVQFRWYNTLHQCESSQDIHHQDIPKLHSRTMM